MKCDAVSLITLDDVLRFVLRGVVHVALETNVGDNLLHDDAANSTCLGVPFDVITALERLGHSTLGSL